MSGNMSLSTLEESKLMSNNNSAERKKELDFSPFRQRERDPVRVRSLCAAIKGLNKENLAQKPKCYSEENEAVNYIIARMLNSRLSNSLSAKKCGTDPKLTTPKFDWKGIMNNKSQQHLSAIERPRTLAEIAANNQRLRAADNNRGWTDVGYLGGVEESIQYTGL